MKVNIFNRQQLRCSYRTGRATADTRALVVTKDLVSKLNPTLYGQLYTDIYRCLKIHTHFRGEQSIYFSDILVDECEIIVDLKAKEPKGSVGN